MHILVYASNYQYFINHSILDIVRATRHRKIKETLLNAGKNIKRPNV